MRTRYSHVEDKIEASEGFEDRFSRKFLTQCIEFISGGLMRKGADMWEHGREVIILDTRFGVVHWINCPT